MTAIDHLSAEIQWLHSSMCQFTTEYIQRQIGAQGVSLEMKTMSIMSTENHNDTQPTGKIEYI